MKFLATTAVVLVCAGCASMSGPRSISWESVSHPNQTNGVAAVENHQLVLENREVRTDKTYATPLTLECDASPSDAVSSDFGIKFVPSTASGASGELERMFVLGFVKGSSLMAGFSIASLQGSELATHSVWEKRGDSQWLVLKPGDACHIRLTLNKDHLEIGINGQTFSVREAGLPYERFRIQLSCLGATNRWSVRNFVVH
jgi:hypothetical protein